MSYAAGVSGGSNLYDMLKYRLAMASQQSSAASGSSPLDSLTGSSTSSSASSTTSTSLNLAPTGSSSPATAGISSNLSSELANLLMEFQQVLGQMGSELSGQSATDTPSAPDGTSTVTISEPAPDPSLLSSTPTAPSAPTQPHQHHHESASTGASTDATPTATNASTSTADPLDQLLGAAFGTSSSPLTQSSFEQAFANGANPAKAETLFAKLDVNSDGTIDQSEAQNALKQLLQPRNAAELQSPSGTQTGGQGNSSQGGWLSGSNLLFSAQQMGQAA